MDDEPIRKLRKYIGRNGISRHKFNAIKKQKECFGLYIMSLDCCSCEFEKTCVLFKDLPWGDDKE